MAMEYNTSPISLREAKVMLDGLVVADAVKATIKFTPDVWSGKQLGELLYGELLAGAGVDGLVARVAAGWAARSPGTLPDAAPPRFSRRRSWST